MRKVLFLSFLPFLVLACKSDAPKGANGVVYKTAVDYNDYIVNRQNQVMQNIMDFVSVAENDLDSAELLLDKYVIEVGTMVRDLRGMPAFKGDTELRDASVDIFRFYQRIFNEDYRRIIHIRNGKLDLGDGAEAEVERIVEKIKAEERGKDERFHTAQTAFARKNDMQLRDNEMQTEFDKRMNAD